uniref:Uncharacterized protein n=1 Tax=Lactuca sativa TaxID=4236 RepID=A0A9R1VYG3_LACSA|nr:hypothetical protein LSAT_V11C300145980 [Lactuca sativa]
MSMKVDVFEVKWDLLIKDFKLEESIRFKYMFTKCCSLIPGYFNDIPMCDLLKTTSRPEMNYDTAIQKQTNTQRDLEKEPKKASYKMETP